MNGTLKTMSKESLTMSYLQSRADEGRLRAEGLFARAQNTWLLSPLLGVKGKERSWQLKPKRSVDARGSLLGQLGSRR